MRHNNIETWNDVVDAFEEANESWDVLFAPSIKIRKIYNKHKIIGFIMAKIFYDKRGWHALNMEMSRLALIAHYRTIERDIEKVFPEIKTKDYWYKLFIENS